MPMPAYPVICYGIGCGHAARYKVAATWSDGQTCELKTYAIACESCIVTLWNDAKRRRLGYRLIPGETLDEPCIYELMRGSRDRTLVRRNDLESAPPA